MASAIMSRCFIVFIFLLDLLVSVVGAETDFADLASAYDQKVFPVLERHCFSCHDADTQKGDLDLQRFVDLAAVRADPDVWQQVESQVASGEMPPKEKPALQDFEKVLLLDWVGNYLHAEARENAGDPGPVVLRRLSNAEYTYTVQDLTDVESLDPAMEFPVDSAAGEGFANTGESLAMSPAFLEKLFTAGKEIAEHAVFLPDGFRFSGSVSRQDWSNELVAKIRTFYQRTLHAEAIDFSYRDQVGQVVPVDESEGRVNLEPYFAYLLRHRDLIESDFVQAQRAAEVEGLNPHYFAHLARCLVEDQVSGSFLLDHLRALWQAAQPGDAPQLQRWVKEWQDRLWKFNTVGHLAGYVFPWQESVDSMAARRDWTQKLESSGDTMIRVNLISRALGGDGGNDKIRWESPRLVQPGRKPILLRDVEGLSNAFLEFRERIFGVMATLLEVAFTVKENGGSVDLGSLAEEFKVDAVGLECVLDALGLADRGRSITGYLTQTRENVAGHAAISAWGLEGVSDLSIVANRSDQPWNIPGELPPHSVAVHPHPERSIAVGWLSPMSGEVTVTAHVQSRHGCGNGTHWVVQHADGQQERVLSKGNVSPLEKATIAPFAGIMVGEGDVISLVIDAHNGDHSCDLTEIELAITETANEGRHWSLREDCADSILAGNPHHDRFGYLDTWHFYSESPQMNPVPDRSIPENSLLARWLETNDRATAAALGETLQQWLLGGELSDSASEADRELVRRLCVLDGPLFAGMDVATLIDDHVGWEAFGHLFTEAGHLEVPATSNVQVALLPAFAAGWDLVTTGTFAEGSEGFAGVQLAVQVGESERELASTDPIITLPGSVGEEHLRRAYEDFRQLFPAAMCYARVVPIDEVVTLILYHREDAFLKRLMLDDGQRQELDQLWDELLYVSRDAFRLETALEQLLEFATQDADPSKFDPMLQPVSQRAAELRERLEATESVQLNALMAFAARAYRRPVTTEEAHGLRALYHRLRSDGLAHEQAFRLTLARVFTAPAFLYRAEVPAQGGVVRGPVTSWEQATRLSYFLWSSMPDDALMEAAGQGTLTDPDALFLHARRMLGDAKIRRLAEHFACQWLHVRDFDTFDEKNERLFPEFATLRGAMYEEALRFFTDLFQNDGSILSILNADHSFVNAKLAAFYDLPQPVDDGWQRVGGLRLGGRGGILGMAATLAKHSGASRTSPILRGNWVYETLLGERLPKPPKGVPVLPEEADVTLTERQMIERHSADASCAKCHSKIDPFGFALEQFDAMGRRRPEVADTTTQLSDGTPMEGLDGLRTYLVHSQRDRFVRQFCRKLLGYALGRSVRLSDETLLEEMMNTLAGKDYRFHVAVEAIVRSPQFREIRGETQEDHKP